MNSYLVKAKFLKEFYKAENFFLAYEDTFVTHSAWKPVPQTFGPPAVENEELKVDISVALAFWFENLIYIQLSSAEKE